MIALISLLLVTLVNAGSVSISGFSSGAYFAVQYEFAYSSSVIGAAIFAGGPYYCAEDSAIYALTICMSNAGSIDLGTLEGYAKTFASNGWLDSTSNLKNHNVFLYSGELDSVVSPSVVKTLQKMYSDMGVTRINTQYGINGVHGFPTLSYGAPCNQFGSPFINNCAYDGAGTALTSIFGSLNPRGQAVANNLYTIKQGNFTPNSASPSSISMDSVAYVYMPTGCKSSPSSCNLHIVMHGCSQGVSSVGTVFVKYAGYNEWAESNNIIILYPQAISSTLFPTNPEGCWDWWGYNESHYADKLGSQMQTVNNMVKHFQS